MVHLGPECITLFKTKGYDLLCDVSGLQLLLHGRHVLLQVTVLIEELGIHSEVHDEVHLQSNSGQVAEFLTALPEGQDPAKPSSSPQS